MLHDILNNSLLCAHVYVYIYKSKGRIAHDFASTLSVLGCNITAVAASHNNNTIMATSRAKHFANRFAIPNYYGSYNELAMDPNVDIVYVATTNQNHMEPTLMMLRGGKNVLVEKPTTITHEETKLMYDEAEVCVIYSVVVCLCNLYIHCFAYTYSLLIFPLPLSIEKRIVLDDQSLD